MTTTAAHSRLDELAYRVETAKFELSIAKRMVECCEQELIEALPCSKLEGSETTSTEFFRITTTGKLTRALDEEALCLVRSRIPEGIFDRVIRYKPELILRDLRYVEANEPDVYRLFADAITTKPAKTTLKIERILNEE